MPAVTVVDLNNAQRDTVTIADFANSSAPTTITRLGATVPTRAGLTAEFQAEADALLAATQAEADAQLEAIQDASEALIASLGYIPPVPYAAGLSMTVATQTVEHDGEVYAPILAELPFTTSGTFETAKFRLIEGISSAALAANTGSTLIGHKGPGASVVTRTVAAKLQELGLGITDKTGADPTGVTDSRAAIAAADAEGRGFYVPASGTFLVSSNLTLTNPLMFLRGSGKIKPAAGVNIHLAGGYLADDWQHCFDIGAAGSSVTGERAPLGYYTPQQFGANPLNDAVDDMPAIEAATEFATLNPVRNEYAQGLPVKFPHPGIGRYYLTKTREIYVARTTHWFGEMGGTQREFGGVEIRCDDGLSAVAFCFAPGGLSAPSEYEPANLPTDAIKGIGKAYGGTRSTFEDLCFRPMTQGGVKQAFVHNTVVYMNRCRAWGYSQVGFHAHAHGSGSIINRFAHPGIGSTGNTSQTVPASSMLYNGTGAVFGNCNGSSYNDCYAMNGLHEAGVQGGAHGYVSHGNNCGLVHWKDCDASQAEGAGFLENTTIGCKYTNTHAASNSWIVVGRDPMAVITTTTTAIVATNVSFDVTDASAIVPGMHIAVALDSGSSWVGLVNAKVGNTLTLATPSPGAAAIGKNVHNVLQYVPIKGKTAAVADEPGVGANWQTYWIRPVATAIQPVDGVWAVGTYFHPACDYNVSAVSSRSTFEGCYSEGAEGVGGIMRGATHVMGGWLELRTRWHGEFDSVQVGQAGTGYSKSPVGFRGERTPGDDTTEYGGSWGANGLYDTGRIQQFGDKLDDSTNGTSAMRMSWNAARGRYEWVDASNSSKPVAGFSGTGWNGTGYTAITQAYPWVNGMYLGDGTTTGTTVNRMRSCQTLASITDATFGAAVRGDTWLYTQPSAAGKRGAVCTTAGTLGSTAVIKEFGAIDA